MRCEEFIKMQMKKKQSIYTTNNRGGVGRGRPNNFPRMHGSPFRIMMVSLSLCFFDFSFFVMISLALHFCFWTSIVSSFSICESFFFQSFLALYHFSFFSHKSSFLLLFLFLLSSFLFSLFVFLSLFLRK